MYRPSDFKKQNYKTGEVAQILGVTPKTVQNYDKNGTLKVHRSATNRRVVSREDLLDYLEKAGLLSEDDRRDVIYVCADGDDANAEMNRQVGAIVAGVSDLQKQIVICDIGKSSDDSRSGFNRLLNMVKDGAVRCVYVTDSKVLSEFGYRTLSVMFNGYGTTIRCLND